MAMIALTVRARVRKLVHHRIQVKHSFDSNVLIGSASDQVDLRAVEGSRVLTRVTVVVVTQDATSYPVSISLL